MKRNKKTNKTGFMFYGQKNIFYGFLIFGLIFGLSGGASAADCGTAIKNCACGDTLMNDYILTAADHVTTTQCLGNGLIIGVDNITINGAGYSITGSDTGHGIYAIGRNNVIIKNFNIYNFSDGIYLQSSSNNIVTENTVTFSTREGILLEYSSSNTVSNNNADSNNYDGIVLFMSNNNNLTDNTANSNNYDGIGLSSSSNNTITNNTANSNNVFGINLHYSSNNTITNNTANSNNYYGIRLYHYSIKNTIVNNTVKENLKYDIHLYTWTKLDSHCDNIIENNTGSGDRPIKFFNYSVDLQNEILSELILCNADNSDISNVTIIGSESLKNNGVLVFKTENSNLTNINSSNNYDGISLISSSSNTLRNNTANSNSNGVHIYEGSENNIINNNANSNSNGIYIERSGSNNIINNNANSNSNGIYLYSDVKNNTLINNTANDNQMHGLYIISTGATGNTINLNTFCLNNQSGGDYYDVYDADTNSGDNNTCDKTYNWDDSSAASEGCTYTCDTCFCNSCSDCNDKLNNPDCSVVILTKDIRNHSETCIYNPASNKIFDCEGNTIDGTGSDYEYGVHIYNRTNITIKNCAITDFYDGIYVSFSSNTITGNTLSLNKHNGIHLLGSSNSSITNNTASNNGEGIYLQISNDNVVANNTFLNNVGLFAELFSGILLESSHGNNITGNEILYNYRGIYLAFSSYNAVTENTVNSNTYEGIYLYYSSNNNLITKNAVNSNGDGIYINIGSNFNKISDNKISYNSETGITMSGCDPYLASYPCSWGNSNNTIQENEISNNSIGIYSQNSNSTINSNIVCNNNLDFNSSNWLSSSGDNNTCDNPDGWNDTGTAGCTYSCPCYCGSCEDCTNKLNNNSCDVVKLTANITNHTVDCIHWPTNNKIFDCQKHTIDGDDYGPDKGIYLNGKSGNTVRNCVITDFDYGIILEHSSGSTLERNTLKNNWVGIDLEHSSDNALTNNTANNNDYGIVLIYPTSDNNILSRNTVNNNSVYGISLFSSSDNNIITNNTVNNNNKGIHLSDSSDNTIQKNEISNNNIGIYSYNSNSIITSNYVCNNVNSDFNSSNWLSSSGDNNTCNNADGWNDTGTAGCTYPCPCYCGSCEDCTNKLNNNSCDVVKLTANIINHTVDCIHWPANNKIFDCQEHTIDGDDYGPDKGIYLNGKSGNTVRNCVITDFDYGIILEHSSGSTLERNTIKNSWAGIILEHSSYNALTNNTANNNDYGILLIYSTSDNNITSNTVNSNFDGIWLGSSSNNIITSNTVNSNYNNGIHLSYSSNNNTIINNLVNSNGNEGEPNASGIYLYSSSDNTIQKNEISNNNIGIYSQNSDSIINSNYVCRNTNLDFNSSDWLTSSGDNNTCNNADGWNDTGKEGCSFYCYYHPYDINHDGIYIQDYNDLITAYKCLLRINKNCDKISFQNWKSMKQEYNCFTGII